jgi:hypothetical protein
VEAMIRTLIEAYKTGGKGAEQEEFMRLTEGKKLYEVVALREKAHREFRRQGLI